MTHCAHWPVGFVMPTASPLTRHATTAHGAVMGKIRHDDCRGRVACESQRIRMWQRQYAAAHRDYLTAAETERETTDADGRTKAATAAADALGRLVQLAEWIAKAHADQDAILDEHNAHTAGTWTHAHRPAHVPVSA